MTIRIIKEGRLPENDTYRCTCRHCKTVFEFQKKDAKSGYDQRDGSWMTINCPLCSKNVNVSASDKVEITEDESTGHTERVIGKHVTGKTEYYMHSMPGYYDDGVYGEIKR